MSRTHPNISPRALGLLKYLEGLRLTSYLDTAGVWTIGYGHTHKVAQGQRITPAQAEALLRIDLDFFEQGVFDACPGIPQNPFDAAVLFAFNVGMGRVEAPRVPGFLTSTVLQRLREKDYLGAAKALGMWNKSRVKNEDGEWELAEDDILTRRRWLEGRVMVGDFPSEEIR